jgi:hypothetical protein
MQLQNSNLKIANKVGDGTSAADIAQLMQTHADQHIHVRDATMRALRVPFITTGLVVVGLTV